MLATGSKPGGEQIRLQLLVGEGPVGQALGVGRAVVLEGDRDLELARGATRASRARAGRRARRPPPPPPAGAPTCARSRASSPPSRSTPRIAASAARRSRACVIELPTQKTASNGPPSSSSHTPHARRHRTPCSAASARVRATISALASEALTSKPRSASPTASVPVPHAQSSTRAPAGSSATHRLERRGARPPARAAPRARASRRRRRACRTRPRSYRGTRVRLARAPRRSPAA